MAGLRRQPAAAARHGRHRRLSDEPDADDDAARGARSETEQFVATVLADTEDVWGKRFQAAGESYAAPTLVLFDGRVGSACGSASAAMGPFYCPDDQKVYLDTQLLRPAAAAAERAGRLRPGLCVAHEVGHHVQNLLGILPRYHKASQGMSRSDANALSVRIELQADCFAGIWAHDESSAGYLEPGDIGEATNAAEQIGDDTLQKRSQGTVVPDCFTHGTSAQRQQWFETGYRERRRPGLRHAEGRDLRMRIRRALRRRLPIPVAEHGRAG